MISSSQSETGRYSLLGKYRILSHVARGGIAAVYRAYDTHLHREVALKILPPDVAGKTLMLERFRREACHAAKLHHPHIVSIYEFGEVSGTFYLALEFVHGIDLHQYTQDRGQLTPQESLVFITHAARALEHLHSHAMIHRDIKPANVLVTRHRDRPFAKLTDLGLARVIDDDEFRLTQTNCTVGTIDYMAPEQARDSSAADIRSDIYSLGCTWYELLSGRAPFSEGNAAERLYKHLHTPPSDIRQWNDQVSAGMADVLNWMLAKDPLERYQTPTELLQDLRLLRRSRKATDGSQIGPKKAPRKKREAGFSPGQSPQETVTEITVTPQVATPSTDQRRVALGQFERATDVIARGDYDYGVHLLLSCCKLEPANLGYRRALRRAERTMNERKRRGGPLAFLATSPARTRLKAAKAAGEHLRVLEHGEEILARSPWDTSAQLDMADAAQALRLDALAVWILEQAIDEQKPDIAVSRALARCYEKRGNFSGAITQWELVRQADPNDIEASRKPRDLAARETISRVQSDRDLEQDSG
jgi:serine/threonine protein kinase